MPARIAVIGSGATAVAVLDAVSAAPIASDVTLFHPPERFRRQFEFDGPMQNWSMSQVSTFYKALRREFGLKFPPPKTTFGTAPGRLRVDGWGDIWSSPLQGGLTWFWGGSMLPFAEDDFDNWPIERGALTEHYRAIAERVGISGRTDMLNQVLGEEFCAYPSVEPIPPIARFLSDFASQRRSGDYEMVAGAARVAIDTRVDSATSCTRSGECMTGCARDAVYRASRTIADFLNDGTVDSVVEQQVVRIDPDTRQVVGTTDTFGGFDQIYVCAGCVHTTEILMRSLGLRAGEPMTDNSVLSFPVFALGSLPATLQSGYVALTNGLAIVRPKRSAGRHMLIQFYPNADYFWRYFAPPSLWFMFNRLGQVARNRIFWARLYLPSEESAHYDVGLDDDGRLDMRLLREPKRKAFLSKVWPHVRRMLSGNGFWVPPVAPVVSKTSSHYAGTLPMGGEITSPSGQVSKGVYVCDSSVFPDCSAFSHTYTMMANARRIAMGGLADMAS